MPNISTSLSLAKQTPLDEVPCTVERVYEAKTGENDKGPWTVQDLRVTDDSGETYVSCWNYKGDLEKLVGKSVILKSKRGQRGLNGLYVDENKGKKKLKLTEAGGIEVVGAAGSSPRQPTDSRVEYDKPEDVTPKQRIYQATQCYIDCVGAAHLIRKEILAKHEVQMTPEHFQSVCASLFIFADKHHLVGSYPTHPEKKDE